MDVEYVCSNPSSPCPLCPCSPIEHQSADLSTCNASHAFRYYNPFPSTYTPDRVRRPPSASLARMRSSLANAGGREEANGWMLRRVGAPAGCRSHRPISLCPLSSPCLRACPPRQPALSSCGLASPPSRDPPHRAPSPLLDCLDCLLPFLAHPTSPSPSLSHLHPPPYTACCARRTTKKNRTEQKAELLYTAQRLQAHRSRASN